MGKVYPETSYTARLNFDFELQFIPNTQNYAIKDTSKIFKAISRVDESKSRDDCITFTALERTADDKTKGIYRVKARVIKDADDIMIIPSCVKVPEVSTVTPVYSVAGVSCANNIYVTFNKPVSLSDFTEVDDSGTITGFKNIEIYSGSINLLDDEENEAYFNYPKILDDGYTLEIPVNKNHLLYDNSSDNAVKEISVLIKTTNIKDAVDSLYFTEDLEWTYRVNSSTEVAPRIDNLLASKTITNYNGETKTANLDNTAFENWVDEEENSPFKNNHVKDSVHLGITAQGTYQINKIFVKETLKNYANGSDANITFDEKSYTPDCQSTGDYSWKSDEFVYNIRSEKDGLIELEIYYLDTLQNKSNSKKIYVIRDTAYTASLLGYGLENPREVCDDGTDHASFGFKTIEEEYYDGKSEPIIINKVEWYSEEQGEAAAVEIEPQERGFYDISGVSKFYNVRCNPNVNNCFVIYSQDSVGNLNKSIVAIPKKAFVVDVLSCDERNYACRIRIEKYNFTFSKEYHSAIGFYKDGYSEEFYINQDDRHCRKGFVDKYPDISGRTLEYITSAAYLKFFEWTIYGCNSSPVYYCETADETVNIPHSLNFTMEDAVQNAEARTVHAQFVLSDEQQSIDNFYNPKYEYLIKAEYKDSTNTLTYAYYNPESFSLKSNYTYKLYPCVRTPKGAVYVGTTYRECDPTQEDNIVPYWNTSVIPCTNGAKFYVFPSDDSGIYNTNGIVTLKYFYIPNNGVSVVQSKTDEELMEYINTGNYKTVSYDSNNKPVYLIFPFDGLLPDWYTLYVYVEDTSPLKNYAFFSFAQSNMTNSKVLSISKNKTNNKICMTVPGNQAPFVFEIYKDGCWKNYATRGAKYATMNSILNAAYDSNGSTINLTNLDATGQLGSLYIGEANSLPGKFARFTAVNDLENCIPLYFYYSYYMDPSAYSTKNKSINTNVIGGIQIYTDIPVLVHTFWCSRNLGESKEDSYNDWLLHGTETGIVEESETFTYTNDNLKGVPDNAYYVTIAHFADGKILMSNVKQK